MGIHTAEPSASDEGYYGLGVHRAARIMAAAHGGQTLVSLAASSVLEDAELDGAHLRDLGEYWLKDLERPERLYQLEAAGLQKIFPSVAGQRPASVVEPALDGADDALLERDDAISALAESLGDVARTRRGRLVSVTGEAGVGKTSLLRRFCAEQQDARLVWGACDPLFTPRPLRIVLGAFARSRALRRVDLTPLSRDALARLAEPRGIDADELYRRTGGNPFFATEALAAGDAEVPAAVLEAAAVAPPHVPLWLLEALTEGDLDALDECLTSGMLMHRVDGVAFRHELARLAVEDSLSPTRRLTLHRRALSALSEPPTGSPDLERLAHHAEGAGDAVAALRYAPSAGDRAARVGAHREAAAQYGRALRFAASLGPHERAELLHKYSYECYLTDQQQEAFDALERAAAAFREISDTRGEGDSLLQLADILWCPGRTADADETARRAISILEQVEPGRELAMAYVVLAALRKDALDTENAIAYASRAHAIAERVGDAGTRIRALRTIAMAELLAGQVDGLDKLEQSVAMSEAAELPNNVAGAFIYLMQAAALLRMYDIADRYLERALTYTGERGHILSESYLHAFGAKIALDRGRWAEADELCTLVFQKRLTSIFPRVLALTVRALVSVRRGEAGADSLLDEALELAQPSGEVTRIAPVALAQAEVAWLAGDRDGIMAATDRVFGDALEQGGARALYELAFWRWRAGLDAPQ